jgi:hypothetical protein
LRVSRERPMTGRFSAANAVAAASSNRSNRTGVGRAVIGGNDGVYFRENFARLAAA